MLKGILKMCASAYMVQQSRQDCGGYSITTQSHLLCQPCSTKDTAVQVSPCCCLAKAVTAVHRKVEEAAWQPDSTMLQMHGLDDELAACGS